MSKIALEPLLLSGYPGASRATKILPKSPQDVPRRPKIVPGRFKTAPGRPKTPPGRLQGRPGAQKIAPGRPQDASTGVRGAQKSPQDAPKTPPRAPGHPKNHPGTPPRRLHGRPGSPKIAPGRPQDASKGVPEAQNHPQIVSGCIKTAPKSPQHAPRADLGSIWGQFCVDVGFVWTRFRLAFLLVFLSISQNVHVFDTCYCRGAGGKGACAVNSSCCV